MACCATGIACSFSESDSLGPPRSRMVLISVSALIFTGTAAMFSRAEIQYATSSTSIGSSSLDLRSTSSM